MPLTYSKACALLAEYAIALQDRQNCGDEMQPAYMKALKACTDAMGVQPPSSARACRRCMGARTVEVDGDAMPCPECCCWNCGVAPGEPHPSVCSVKST